MDAILYIVRGGIARRQLPVDFPLAGTMYAVFARWAHSGAWQHILDALRDRLRVRDGRDRCPTAAIIDSQTVLAADTVPRSSRGWDGGKRTNGVKRRTAVYETRPDHHEAMVHIAMIATMTRRLARI